MIRGPCFVLKWFSPPGLEFASNTRQQQKTHQGYSSRPSDTRTHVVRLIFSFPCTNEQRKHPRPSFHYFSSEKSMSTGPTRQHTYRQLTAVTSLCIHVLSGSTAWLYCLARPHAVVRASGAGAYSRSHISPHRTVHRHTPGVRGDHIHAHTCKTQLQRHHIPRVLFPPHLCPLALFASPSSSIGAPLFRRRPIPPPPPPHSPFEQTPVSLTGSLNVFR